jgi:hypothetical protein
MPQCPECGFGFDVEALRFVQRQRISRADILGCATERWGARACAFVLNIAAAYFTFLGTPMSAAVSSVCIAGMFLVVLLAVWRFALDDRADRPRLAHAAGAAAWLFTLAHAVLAVVFISR